MRDVASGAPTLTDAELDAFMASKTALAFFRKRAGFTQTDAAGKLGVSQAYLAQIESGVRKGTVDLYLKLSRILAFGWRI